MGGGGAGEPARAGDGCRDALREPELRRPGGHALKGACALHRNLRHCKAQHGMSVANEQRVRTAPRPLGPRHAPHAKSARQLAIVCIVCAAPRARTLRASSVSPLSQAAASPSGGGPRSAAPLLGPRSSSLRTRTHLQKITASCPIMQTCACWRGQGMRSYQAQLPENHQSYSQLMRLRLMRWL